MRKDKKGFTLIELLAVIIILGILMLVAVPAVSSYIMNSRKSAYVSTAKAIMKGTMNLANDGTLDLTSTETTYYIPASCVDVDNTTKSPYGDFVKAYTAIGFDGESFSYYWLSVDDTGMGVTNLVSNETISTNDIVSGIDSDDIDSDLNIPSKSKIMVYNADCTSSRQERGIYEVTFDAGEGEFEGGSKENVLTYPKRDRSETTTVTKYSYTQNLSEDGTKNSNYGSSWTNANIRGTNRGSLSQAHVVSIQGASSLHVKVYYGGESKSFDYLCVWKGSHPDYSAADNSTTAIDGKIGATNSSDPIKVKEFDVEGDTITLSYRTDGGGIGNNDDSKGYGYYAIITGEGKEDTFTGTYKIPILNGHTFEGWIDNETNQRYQSAYDINVNTDKRVTASFKSFSSLRLNTNSNNYIINGNTFSSAFTYSADLGSSLDFTIRLPISGYSPNGAWYITYDSDGGSTTPAQVSCQKMKRCDYFYNGLNTSGSCEGLSAPQATTDNVYNFYAYSYTFPNTAGALCTIQPNVSTQWTDYYANPKTLAGAPTKEGYTFEGWRSSLDNQIYGAGESYTPTGDVTMTAQWTPVG